MHGRHAFPIGPDLEQSNVALVVWFENACFKKVLGTFSIARPELPLLLLRHPQSCLVVRNLTYGAAPRRTLSLLKIPAKWQGKR